MTAAAPEPGTRVKVTSALAVIDANNRLGGRPQPTIAIVHEQQDIPGRLHVIATETIGCWPHPGEDFYADEWEPEHAEVTS